LKLEIEITEDEIRSAIERKIRVAVADETNSYGAGATIKAAVKKQWAEVMDRLVKEALNDTPALRAQIEAAISAKLRGQITSLMKSKA
jgi:hypothetical protein